MSIMDFSPSRNRWAQLVLNRFHESRLPSLLAYGLSGLSITLGLILYSSDPVGLLVAGYGPLLASIHVQAWSLALVLTGASLLAFYSKIMLGALVPAGLLCLAYSFMALSAALGGQGWWSGLFVLMLFAGYASALLVFTPVGRGGPDD